MEKTISIPKQFVPVYDNELSVFTSEESRKLKINSYTYLVFACLKQQIKFKESGNRASTSARSLERIFCLPSRTAHRELKKLMSHESGIVFVQDEEYKVKKVGSKDEVMNPIPVSLLNSPTLDVKVKQFLAVFHRHMDREKSFSTSWSKYQVWNNAFKPLGRGHGWVTRNIKQLSEIGLVEELDGEFKFNMENVADYNDKVIMVLSNKVAEQQKEIELLRKKVNDRNAVKFEEFDYGVDMD